MLDIKKYNDYIAPEQRIDNKITGDILFQAIYHDIIYGDDSIMYISKYINDRFDKITDILSLEMRISYKHFLINMIEYTRFIPHEHVYIKYDNIYVCGIYINVFIRKHDIIKTYITKLLNIFNKIHLDICVENMNEKIDNFILLRN